MYYYKPDLQENLRQHINQHSISSNGIIEVILKDGSVQKFDVKDKNNKKAYNKEQNSDKFTEIRDFPKENLELIAKEFEYTFRKKGIHRNKQKF